MTSVLANYICTVPALLALHTACYTKAKQIGVPSIISLGYPSFEEKVLVALCYCFPAQYAVMVSFLLFELLWYALCNIFCIEVVHNWLKLFTVGLTNDCSRDIPVDPFYQTEEQLAYMLRRQ
jgi:hypothetical protein